MPSLIKVLAEETRQELAKDDRFYKSFIYFFELQIPSDALEGYAPGLTISHYFPLMLNPQGITMTEPFTVQATPTAEGGLFVEENGVIQRSITITGHTGFKPRPNKSSVGSDFTKIENPSFERRGVWTPDTLSGQRHFHFLQDRVFRVYGDLKRDPATARDTKLIFHNSKDEEAWHVVPTSFTMERNARSPAVYNYRIDLLVVEKALALDLDFSEDKGLLDSIKDTIRSIKSFADNLQGAINDVLNFIEEIEDVVSGTIRLLEVIADFQNAVSDLIDGTANAIARPLKTVASVTSQIEGALNRLAETSQFGPAKDTIMQSFRQMEDAFDGFGIHTEAYETDSDKQLREDKKRQELTVGASTSSLEAAAENPPASSREVTAAGSGHQPGDINRRDGELGLARADPSFPSAKEHVLQQGDTLPSLAARHLGDARKWRKIALLNNLRPPFITEQGLPGTIKIGSRILVPSRAKPPKSNPLTVVFGVPREEPAEARFLGTDLQLDPVDADPRFFDFVIDAEGGSTDFKAVSGVENLKQAVRTRVMTEQGTDVLYHRLGYQGLVGLGIVEVDSRLAELRVAKAVEADPRILEVRNLQFTGEEQNADVVDVEMDAVVRGLSERVRLSAAV